MISKTGRATGKFLRTSEDLSVYLEKRTDQIMADDSENIRKAFKRALRDANQFGKGFIEVTKSKHGDYFINQKLWHEIKESLEDLGCTGPLGGRIKQK